MSAKMTTTTTTTARLPDADLFAEETTMTTTTILRDADLYDEATAEANPVPDRRKGFPTTDTRGAPGRGFSKCVNVLNAKDDFWAAAP